MADLSEPFAYGESFMHRLDPRIKLVSGVLVTLPTAVASNCSPACLALVLACILVLMAKLDPKKILARLLVINGFIAFLWLFLPFSTPGTEVWSMGPFSATAEGIRLSTLITIKSNAIAIALMALVATIPVQTLGRAMQELRIPDKLCNLLLFSYRYIFVIEREYQRLTTAQRARGFRPGTNMHTYKTYAYLVGMLLVKSWDRAERVYQAMLCRGFRNKFYSLTEFACTTRDWTFLAAAILCCAFLATDELTPILP